MALKGMKPTPRKKRTKKELSEIQEAAFRAGSTYKALEQRTRTRRQSLKIK